MGLIAAAVALTHAAGDRFDGDKMLADVKAYADFGAHRTGTPGDVATRKWLASRFEALGLNVELEPFLVNQFLLDTAHVVAAGKTYEAMPYRQSLRGVNVAFGLEPDSGEQRVCDSPFDRVERRVAR